MPRVSHIPENHLAAAQKQKTERSAALVNALERMQNGSCEWALITANATGAATLLCSDTQAVMMLSDALCSMITVEYAHTATIH